MGPEIRIHTIGLIPTIVFCCLTGASIAFPYNHAAGGGTTALILTFLLAPIAVYILFLVAVGERNDYQYKRYYRHKQWHEGRVKSDRVIPLFSKTWGVLMIFLAPLILAWGSRVAHQADRDSLHTLLWWLRYPSIPVIFVGVGYYQDFLIPSMVRRQMRGRNLKCGTGSNRSREKQR